jgi:hypothetical protein
VTVGKVNVEAGGQAIVGNIQTGTQAQKVTKAEDSQTDAVTEETDGTEE